MKHLSTTHSTLEETEAFPPPRSFRPTPPHVRHRPLRPKRGIEAIVGATIAIALIAIALCVAFSMMKAHAQSALNESGGLGSASIHQDGQSTPQSEWQQGTVPMLYQTDPAWANEPYAGSDIKTAGCGPTCLSMVYVALTGKTDMGPSEMAAFSEKGGFVQDGMTAWAFMVDGAAELGLSAEELPASEDALVSALEEGRPVIASMVPGDFTTTGHFIVIAGVDDSGKLIVRDPNSAERSAQAWDAQTILAQCANLWAYSKSA